MLETDSKLSQWETKFNLKVLFGGCFVVEQNFKSNHWKNVYG